MATAGGLALLATQSSPATRSEMVPVPCAADSWLDISLHMLTFYFCLSQLCVFADGVVRRPQAAVLASAMDVASG